MSDTSIQQSAEYARRFFERTAAYRQYLNHEMARMDRESIIQNAQEEGLEKGKNRLAQLMNILFKEGLVKEAQQATLDPIFRKDLYKKYHL